MIYSFLGTALKKVDTGENNFINRFYLFYSIKSVSEILYIFPSYKLSGITGVYFTPKAPRDSDWAPHRTQGSLEFLREATQNGFQVASTPQPVAPALPWSHLWSAGETEVQPPDPLVTPKTGCVSICTRSRMSHSFKRSHEQSCAKK